MFIHITESLTQNKMRMGGWRIQDTLFQQHQELVQFNIFISVSISRHMQKDTKQIQQQQLQNKCAQSMSSVNVN